MVLQGVVRQLDKDGNDRADEAAGLGRRHVGADVVDGRTHVHNLHWFFIVVARMGVKDVRRGGSAHHPVVWSERSLLERYRVERAIGDYARLSGPVNLWAGGWQGCLAEGSTFEDVSVWPCSLRSLVTFFYIGSCRVASLTLNLGW